MWQRVACGLTVCSARPSGSICAVVRGLESGQIKLGFTRSETIQCPKAGSGVHGRCWLRRKWISSISLTSHSLTSEPLPNSTMCSMAYSSVCSVRSVAASVEGHKLRARANNSDLQVGY